MSPVNNTKHTVLTCTAHLCPLTQSTQSSPVQLTYVPYQQHKAHSPHLYSSLMSPVNKTKHTVLISTAHLCPLSTKQSTQSSPVQLTYVPCQQHKAHSLHQYSSLMSPNTKHTVLTSPAHLCPLSTTQSTQSSFIQLACHLTTTQCRHKHQQRQNRHVTSTKWTCQQFSSQCGS